MSKEKSLQPKLGKVIRKIRTKQKTTITKLAFQTGISVFKIKAIEKGDVMPTKNEIQWLSKAFDLPKEAISILSIQRKHVPKHKQELYDILFPAITRMFYELV